MKNLKQKIRLCLLLESTGFKMYREIKKAAQKQSRYRMGTLV